MPRSRCCDQTAGIVRLQNRMTTEVLWLQYKALTAIATCQLLPLAAGGVLTWRIVLREIQKVWKRQLVERERKRCDPSEVISRPGTGGYDGPKTMVQKRTFSSDFHRFCMVSKDGYFGETAACPAGKHCVRKRGFWLRGLENSSEVGQLDWLLKVQL